ncbi:hypothetical protein GCM10027168_03490 [Streptomyces capparidis]
MMNRSDSDTPPPGPAQGPRRPDHRGRHARAKGARARRGAHAGPPKAPEPSVPEPRTTPEHPAPEPVTPERTTPEHPAPEPAAPRRTAAKHAAPKHPAPEHPGSPPPAAAPAAPRRPAPRHAAPASPVRTGAPPRSPIGYEPWLNGLFTYCLSVMGEHDTATAALGDALAFAERHHARLRDPALLRAWLYALARHACLRRLHPPPAHAAALPPTAPLRDGTAAGARHVAPRHLAPRGHARRLAELDALAWPEAAGLPADQREALELAVRHGLHPREVAAVLALDPAHARALLARAAREVERTTSALAVADRRECPGLARLAGAPRELLGTVLRGELVSHAEGCPRCLATAERLRAVGPWPLSGCSEVLAIVPAPRAAVFRAMVAPAGGTRRDGGGARGRGALVLRLDRHGFPVPPRPRGGGRLRQRALAATVVAAAVAVPVVALWPAYRGGHEATAHDPPVSASDDEPEGGGAAHPRHRHHPGQAPARHQAGSATAAPSRQAREPRASASRSGSPSGSSAAASAPGGAGSGPSSQRPAPGRLTVAHTAGEGSTRVTLRNTGGTPLAWRASPSASWLVLSQTAGELAPGAATAVTASADGDRQPHGAWEAYVYLEPGGQAVPVRGRGAPPPSSSPSSPQPSEPAPPPAERSGTPARTEEETESAAAG